MYKNYKNTTTIHEKFSTMMRMGRGKEGREGKKQKRRGGRLFVKIFLKLNSKYMGVHHNFHIFLNVKYFIS